MKKVKFTSPYGVAQYPHISSPDTKGKFADNKYKTKIVCKIDSPSALAAVEKIKAAATDIHGKAGVKMYMPFVIDEEEGTITFNAKSQYAPVVMDVKGNKVGKNVRIRGGSTLALAGFLIEYDKGIAFQLHQVRVKSLSDDSFDFEEVEDGYVYDPSEDDSTGGFDAASDDDEDDDTGATNGSALDI